MYHVEFLGPTGAGKSTVARHVADELHECLFDTSGRHECLTRSVPLAGPLPLGSTRIDSFLLELYWSHVAEDRHAKRYLCRYPQTARALSEVLRVVDDGSGLTDHVDPCSLLDHIVEEMGHFHLLSTEAGTNTPVLIDDGLYQFFLFTLLGDTDWTPARLLRLLPTPDLLVIVDAPSTLCFERQDSRDRGRIGPFRGLDRPTVVQYITEMRRAVDEIADHFERTSGEIVRVENSGPVDRQAGRIVQAVRANGTG